MDISSVAGTSQLVKSELTQQTLSVSMVKQASEQQNMMANLIAQTTGQAPQPASNSGTGYSFSTYA